MRYLISFSFYYRQKSGGIAPLSLYFKGNATVEPKTLDIETLKNAIKDRYKDDYGSYDEYYDKMISIDNIVPLDISPLKAVNKPVAVKRSVRPKRAHKANKAASVPSGKA